MTEFDPIFLRYKGVNEIPVVENPSGDGNFFFYDGGGLKQSPMSVIYSMVQGVKSVLKADDPKPTGAGAIGKYELSDFAEYTNLVPIIPVGSDTPTSTPIETEDGYYNAVYFDGTNFIQIKIEMPNTKAYSRDLLRTSFYPAHNNNQDSISFTTESGRINQISLSGIRISYKGNFAETDEDYVFDVKDDYGYVVATFTDYVAGGLTLEYYSGFEWSPTLTEDQFVFCFVNDGVLYSKYAPIQSLITNIYNANTISDSQYVSLFQNLKAGTVDNQNGMQGSDSWDGEVLTVTGYTVLPMRPKNSYLKVLVKGGNTQVRMSSDDLSSFYFVYQTGGAISIGKTGTGVIGSASSVVDPSKDYYLEIFFGDSQIKARAYNVIAKQNWDVVAATSGFVGNKLTLNEYSGAIKVKDVSYYDNTVELLNKIQFNGYFFEDFYSTEKLLRTFSQGSSFEFETNSSKAVFDGIISSTQTPKIAVSINDGRPMLINLTNSTTLFENLDKTNKKVTVYIDGLYEYDWFWTDPTLGIFIRDIVVDPDSYIRKPVNTLPTIKVVGDSITEGVNVRGTGGNASDGGGYNVYSNVVAKILKMRPLVHGFGGTGIAVGGSGQVPKYLTSVSNYCQGKRTFNEALPKIILINGGTNDAGASVSTSTFTTEYQALIDFYKNRYTSAKIILMVPVNGAYKTQILALGSTNNLQVIDASLFTGITFSDGTHPDMIGTTKLGEQTARQIIV